MTTGEATRPASGKPARSYAVESRAPAAILVFLLPLIAFYEICLLYLLRTGDGLSIQTVEAHRALLRFFQALGIEPRIGLHLGGVVIVLVLLIWQLLSGGSWRLRAAVPIGMAGESLVLAIPLLAINALVAPLAMMPAAGVEFASLNVPSRIAISIGAGLYEELIFRMLLIAAVHTLLVDVTGTSARIAATVAVLISAAAFTPYHDLRGPDGRLVIGRMLFYFLAGVWLALVYIVRGFGIVVGAHAAYDLLTIALSASALPQDD
ncbi:MAG: CPBP family intramembrane metalloprotease [Phycisphaeraceae bacterium]|nr:CPBP family intramembrane metalloprotease [Phycisphaeraceae bacterium]